jgi:hypothetical protein
VKDKKVCLCMCVPKQQEGGRHRVVVGMVFIYHLRKQPPHSAGHLSPTLKVMANSSYAGDVPLLGKHFASLLMAVG